MSAGTWIDWTGGPCPVPLEMLLEIRTLDGSTGFFTAEHCSMAPDWLSERHGARFIAAYRVLEIDLAPAGQSQPKI